MAQQDQKHLIPKQQDSKQKRTQSLADKMVAIGSGKGGVGKSTMSVNLAIVAAREGKKVALVDLDPLSNLHVVLDIQKKEMDVIPDALDLTKKKQLNDYRLKVFSRIDILFPQAKLKRGESRVLRKALFENFRTELEGQYDLIILDMPAGIGQEENLDFLPELKYLIVVSNAEPTSHVSAGGYVKAALEINPALHIFYWHNKFEALIDPDFNPRTLNDNYNRYVPDDLKLSDADRARTRDVAWIPHDPALDLLRADSPYHYHLLGAINEVIKLIDEQVVAELPESTGISRGLRVIARHYVVHRIGELTIAALERYLQTVVGVQAARLPTEHRLWLEKYLLVQARHPFRNRINQALQAIEQYIEAIGRSGALIAQPASVRGAEEKRLAKIAFTHIQTLFTVINHYAKPANQKRIPWPRQCDEMIKKLGGLLLFRYALFRLCSSDSVQALLSSFVPHRRYTDGRRERNRREQIRLLVEQDEAYRTRFFALIKKLHPLVNKQLASYVQSQGWVGLILRDQGGKANHNAYLKLLGRSMHDTLNGGLGVFAGIRHNATAQALRDGCETLLALMKP